MSGMKISGEWNFKMKITKSQLKQIIKEELGRVLNEQGKYQVRLGDIDYWQHDSYVEEGFDTLEEAIVKAKELDDPDSIIAVFVVYDNEIVWSP